MRKRNPASVREAAGTLPKEGRGEIPSDVLGSYTGAARDGGRPIQDADDL